MASKSPPATARSVRTRPGVAGIRRPPTRTTRCTGAPVPSAVAERARRVQSALATALGEDTQATVRAHVHDGKVVFTISSVPAEDLDELCAALMTA